MSMDIFDSAFVSILGICFVTILIMNGSLRRKKAEVISMRRTINDANEHALLEEIRELKIVSRSLKNRNKSLEKRLLHQEDSQIAILNVLEDVDEQRKKVAELTMRFSLATSAAQIGVWELELASGHLMLDKIMRSMFGVSETDEDVNLSIWEKRLYADDRKRTMEQIRNITRKKQEMDIRYRVMLQDHVIRTIRSFGRPIVLSDGSVNRYVGVCLDITKETIIDQQKTEFVSLASHQLKTPVGAISWNLEMLLAGDYGKVSLKQKAIMEEMYIMSRRINDLINGLLNVSRLEMGMFIVEPVPTDVVALCEEVLTEMHPMIVDKEHSLIKKLPKKLPMISVDPKLMRIVFQNYISNAIKYTQKKGKITVSLFADDTRLTFGVANNGEPIPVAEQSHIFEKMYRTTNARAQDPHGNGLGLYLVKKILQEAGGKAWFTSKEGEGTVFYATVPRAGMKRHEGTKALS